MYLISCRSSQFLSTFCRRLFGFSLAFSLPYRLAILRQLLQFSLCFEWNERAWGREENSSQHFSKWHKAHFHIQHTIKAINCYFQRFLADPHPYTGLCERDTDSYHFNISTTNLRMDGGGKRKRESSSHGFRLSQFFSYSSFLLSCAGSCCEIFVARALLMLL